MTINIKNEKKSLLGHLAIHNIAEAKEIIRQLRRGKGNNEMTWGASVVASS
jgi:hypothetical protein